MKKRKKKNKKSMRKNRITLGFDPRHWYWVEREAPRLGFDTPVEYVNRILDTAVVREMYMREYTPVGGEHPVLEIDDGIPF